jgi:predicted  nucleic acid-binding Zn-ribbon protein
MNDVLKKIDQGTPVSLGLLLGIIAIVLTNVLKTEEIAAEARKRGQSEATMVHIQRALEDLRDENKANTRELSSLRNEMTQIRTWVDEIRKREKQ